MTTVVDNEEGQSVFEFLLMLPVMVGLVVIMVEVNTTIQMSIVDQQYARSMATWLTFNSPVFPETNLRTVELDGKNYNQMMIGVSDNVLQQGSSTLQPLASTQTITRTRALASMGSNDPGAEPAMRAQVRVRNTVSLCSQSEVIMSGGQLKPILSPGGGTYNLPENTPIDWQYCRAGITMLVGGGSS